MDVSCSTILVFGEALPGLLQELKSTTLRVLAVFRV